MKLETLDKIWKEYLAHYPDAEILRLDKVMDVLKAAQVACGDVRNVKEAFEQLEKEKE